MAPALPCRAEPTGLDDGVDGVDETLAGSVIPRC